jgi:hypothetical protein
VDTSLKYVKKKISIIPGERGTVSNWCTLVSRSLKLAGYLGTAASNSDIGAGYKSGIIRQ